jgi:hypothetical protein
MEIKFAEGTIGPSLAAGLIHQQHLEEDYRFGTHRWQYCRKDSAQAQFKCYREEIIKMAGTNLIAEYRAESRKPKDKTTMFVVATGNAKGGFSIISMELSMRRTIIKNEDLAPMTFIAYASRHAAQRMVQAFKTASLGALGRHFLPHVLAAGEGIDATFCSEGIAVWEDDGDGKRVAVTWIPSDALDSWDRKYQRVREGLEVPGCVWVKWDLSLREVKR